MTTTIQLRDETVKELKKRKMYDKETYDEIIWDLIEDTMELSAQTKRDIAQAEKDFAQGKSIPWEKVKKEAGL